jgi:hypothetical protein
MKTAKGSRPRTHIVKNISTDPYILEWDTVKLEPQLMLQKHIGIEDQIFRLQQT